MSITTKNGDGGMTSLIKTKNIPKSDERVRLLGNIDELSSYLGMVKSQITVPGARAFLNGVQDTLITVMAGIAEPHSMKYRLKEDEVLKLEAEMTQMSEKFSMPEGWVLPGETSMSAWIDIARTVARRCERQLSAVTAKYGSDKVTKQYLNRLSDYLFILARYADTAMPDEFAENGKKQMDQNQMNDLVVQEVLKRIGGQSIHMTLELAKKLIERVEAFAKEKGKKAVIAVCGADGNPVAVHVMDDAFLVSFDVALKKAYTSAAVKMSTMELGKLIQPGQTFQGLDKSQGDKMVFFGGGVPLELGGRLIGALGVSGGTGEEDHELAEYGRKELFSL